MVPVLVIHITFSSDHRFGFYSGLGIACIYGRNILSMRLHKPVTDWLETLPRSIYRLNMKEKFLLDIIKNNTQSCKITTRKYKDINIQKFENDLEMDYLDNDTTDLETLLKLFENDIISTLDKHAPLKTRRVTHRKKQPYYNEQLRNQKCRVRNRERIWRIYKQQHQRQAFVHERNKYNKMLHVYQIQETSAKIIECANDTKKLYNLVNNITGRVKENPMPPDKSVSSLAEEFADFFIKKS